MENPGILYPYAKDENGNRVEAEKLTMQEASLHQYRCPQCNEMMIPVLKNVHRVKHFRHLGTQDLIGAVGRHEQHVSLAGIHILVQGNQTQDTDKKETEHEGHDEKDDTQCFCVVLISQAAIQEDTFHNKDNRENKEFRESGFPEFVFQKLHHYACTSP